MNNSVYQVFKFIRRERLYIILLIFVILIHLSFLLFDQFLKDIGLDKLFQKSIFEEEEIIPAEKIKEAIQSNPILYLAFTFLFSVFIFFVIAGLICDIVYLYLSQRDRSPISKTQLIEPARWDFWDICKVVIIFLFAQRVMWLADIFLFAIVPHLQDKENLRLMLSATLTDVTAILALLYFVLKEKQENITSLGLTIKRFFANIRYGIFAYIGLIPILAMVMYLTTVMFKMFNIPIEPQPVLVILKEENHIPSLIYMGIFTSLFGPFLEEIFFRGFAYGVFKKRWGTLWGIFISAIFFAYIHANLASFFPIFCLGILLTYLYEITGSLIPSITVHILHNSMSLLFLLFIKFIIG